MSTAISRILKKYMTEKIIDMTYTLENFRKDVVRDALAYMTINDVFEIFTTDELLKGIPSEERLNGLSTDEIFRAIPAEKILKGFSTEEIEAYLKKRQKKAKPKKKLRTAD